MFNDVVVAFSLTVVSRKIKMKCAQVDKNSVFGVLDHQRSKMVARKDITSIVVTNKYNKVSNKYSR